MENGKAYTYKRFMRDGSVKECHAVTRSKRKPKNSKPPKGWAEASA